MLPDSVAWLSSRSWVAKIKVFDDRYNLEDCEKEQQSPNWTLPSSQLCLLIYAASSRSLLVFDALQPLPGEEEQLISDNFQFIIATPKLEKVELETALKVAPHIPIWLVPKSEVDLFKSRWVEDLHLTRRQPAHGSPEIQPAAPDVRDTLGDDSLFDDDSIDDEYMPVVSMESRAGDAGGASPRRLDPSNAALVVFHDRGYREVGGQLSQDASHEVPSWRFSTALPQPATSKSVSADTFGIAAGSLGQSSREASLAPMVHRASTRDASSTGGALTAPPTERDFGSENGPGMDSSTQERAKVDRSEVEAPEDPVSLPGRKRPFTHDDAVHIRTQTEEAPERKRLRRDNILQRPLPQEGTVSIRSQADEVPDLKQLWIERWKEGGEKRQLKVKGRGRELQGILEKSKQRKKSQVTSEEIQQRRKGMLHKVELDFGEE